MAVKKKLLCIRHEKLIGISGPVKGKTYTINGKLSVGRTSENTLSMEDSQVSRHHAVIERLAKGTVLRDLGSGNGTFVGNQEVGECILKNGDVIKIGKSQLLYELIPANTVKPLIPPKKADATPAIMPSPKPGAMLDVVLAAGNSKFEALNEEGTLIALTDSDSTIFEYRPSLQSASTQELLDSQKRLAAIYRANQIISSERDLNNLFRRVMDQIFAMVPAHNGFIILKDEITGKPVNVFAKTASTARGSNIGSKIVSSTIVSRSLEKREALISMNAAKDERFEGGKSVALQNITSVMCVPLIHQNEVLGAVYVDTRGSASAFVQDDLELMAALTGPAAIAICNASYLQKLEKARLELEKSYHDTIVALSNSIEARDHYTIGHSWRVTSIAIQIAKEMGWTEERLKICEMGGVLHDVGKIAVEDAILRKPGILTEEEFAKIKIHSEKGAQMLHDVPFLQPVIPYCLYHHERYDGKGYPFGLAGEKIPIEGRIIAVADAFDAMTSSRSYHVGMDPEIAIAEMTQGKGAQFDPVCVDVFIRCYREGRFAAIMQNGENIKNSVPCPFCDTHMRIPEDATINMVLRCDICKRDAQVAV